MQETPLYALPTATTATAAAQIEIKFSSHGEPPFWPQGMGLDGRTGFNISPKLGSPQWPASAWQNQAGGQTE
jgi:hypothetical protein